MFSVRFTFGSGMRSGRSGEGGGGVCRIGAPTCKNVWTGCYEHRFSIAVEAKQRGWGGGRGGATVFDHLSLG